jgi:hypothetical protein
VLQVLRIFAILLAMELQLAQHLLSLIHIVTCHKLIVMVDAKRKLIITRMLHTMFNILDLVLVMNLDVLLVMLLIVHKLQFNHKVSATNMFAIVTTLLSQ